MIRPISAEKDSAMESLKKAFAGAKPVHKERLCKNDDDGSLMVFYVEDANGNTFCGDAAVSHRLEHPSWIIKTYCAPCPDCSKRVEKEQELEFARKRDGKQVTLEFLRDAYKKSGKK